MQFEDELNAAKNMIVTVQEEKSELAHDLQEKIASLQKQLKV